MEQNQRKLGIVLSYVTLIISNLISIFYTPIIIRHLGQSQYGLFNLGNSVVGYLSILNLGLGSTIVRYIARYRFNKDEETENKLNGNFFIMYNIISLVVVLVGIFIIVNTNFIFKQNMSISELQEMKTILILMVFNLAFTFSTNLFGAVIVAYERFVFLKITTIIWTIISPMMTYPFLLMGYKAVMLTIVNTVINCLTIVTYMIYFFVVLKKKLTFGKLDKDLVREMVKYSLFIALGMIVDRIYWSTDQIILGITSGTVLVAVYSVGTNFGGYYQTFSTTISSVFGARVTQLVDSNSDNEELTDLLIKVGRIQYMVLGLILSGFILYGRQFIYFWAGKGYENAYIIALLLMIPMTIPLIQNIALTIIQSKNKHIFRSIIYLIIALINIVFSYFASLKWGAIGCAFISCMSYIVGNGFVINWYYYKKIGLNIPRFWREIMGISKAVIICLIIGVLLNNYFDTYNLKLLLVLIIGYTLIYTILTYLMSMNDYEKCMVKSIFNKLKRFKYQRV
ncbi:oligosaccharide flippase family protein [Intestinibacter bartlettii]|uniref:oligosaccharide flippase family protein n=1 Tax=Intestinibacter bartlettii TaxID=261299 RepID=UPI003993F9A7